MSMQFIYRRISPTEYQRLLTDEKYLESFLEGELFEKSLYSTITPGEPVTGATKCIDIMDDQFTLHYFLTGESALTTTAVAGPLGSVVFHGAQTQWDAGYSMITYLAPAEVQASAAALAAVTEEELTERFNSDEMQDPRNFPDPRKIPGSDDSAEPRNWQDFNLDTMLMIFILVRDFFQVTAAAGDGLLRGIY